NLVRYNKAQSQKNSVTAQRDDTGPVRNVIISFESLLPQKDNTLSSLVAMSFPTEIFEFMHPGTGAAIMFLFVFLAILSTTAMAEDQGKLVFNGQTQPVFKRPVVNEKILMKGSAPR